MVSPTPVNGTVKPPHRRPNAELRPREYLTEAEVERLMKVAKDNRKGHRDATMLLLVYRHGLRAAQVVTLRWDNVDLAQGKLHVNRVKNGSPSVRSGARGGNSKSDRLLGILSSLAPCQPA